VFERPLLFERPLCTDRISLRWLLGAFGVGTLPPGRHGRYPLCGDGEMRVKHAAAITIAEDA